MVSDETKGVNFDVGADLVEYEDSVSCEYVGVWSVETEDVSGFLNVVVEWVEDSVWVAGSCDSVVYIELTTVEYDDVDSDISDDLVYSVVDWVEDCNVEDPVKDLLDVSGSRDVVEKNAVVFVAILDVVSVFSGIVLYSVVIWEGNSDVNFEGCEWVV